MSRLGDEDRPIVLELKCEGEYTAHVPIHSDAAHRPADAVIDALTESDRIIWAAPPTVQQSYTIEDYTGVTAGLPTGWQYFTDEIYPSWVILFLAGLALWFGAGLLTVILANGGVGG